MEGMTGVVVHKRWPEKRNEKRPVLAQWEKKFYDANGFRWTRLCRTVRKPSACFDESWMHENVLHWDDSAGHEALRRAKSRFFAAYHGYRCRIPMPDPEMYIDKVDHDDATATVIIDSELVAGLEKSLSERSCHEDEEYEDIPIEDIKSTGWGD